MSNSCDPMDYSPPGSSVHGISRQEYWSGLLFPFPGDLSRNWTPVSCTAGRLLQAKLQGKSYKLLLDQFSSVQFSHSVMSNSLRPHELQHIRPPCPSPTPRVYPNPCSLSDAIQASYPPSSPSPPSLNLSQHQGLFKWVSSSHQVAKVLEFQLQHQSFQWTPRTDLF